MSSSPRKNHRKNSKKNQQHTVVGRVIKNPRGFAFVVPNTPVPGIQDDIFLDSKEAETLLTNDQVEIAVEREAKSRRTSGRLINIKERALDTAVGTFKMGAYGPCVEILGKGLDFTAPIEKSDSVRNIVPGSAVHVKLKYEHLYSATPTAEIISVIGQQLDHSTDNQYIIAKYKLNPKFPTSVVSASEKISTTVDAKELTNRLDMRNDAFITIDGATAKDFDDAVFAKRNEKGNYVLYVAVADVAHYVRPKDEIDSEAYKRATSTYFPTFVIPMLPEKLSNGICSLNPNDDRLVMICKIEYDSLGRKLNHSFYEGVIHSKRRCTYEEIQSFFINPVSLTISSDVADSVSLLRTIYKFLNKNRMSRGAIDLDIAETQVIVGPNGEVTGLKKADRLESHRLIEECMLAANEAVSEFIESNKIPMVFRVHELPDKEAIAKFTEVAKGLGVALSKHSVRTHDLYQNILKSINGLPTEHVLNFLLLRSMKQATYSSTNYGHFALASQAYTHFTSPIRRYPDLIVHRILKHFLNNSHKKITPLYSESALEEFSLHCSKRERLAMDAEREMIRMKQVRFAEKHLGEVFSATVISMNSRGLFLEIDTFSLEGFLDIDRLGYGYTFSERTIMYHNQRSGKKIRLGDKMKVQIARTNPHLQQIDLEPLEKNPAIAKTELKRKIPFKQPLKLSDIKKTGKGPQAFLERIEKLKSSKQRKK